jgi:caa(3)-type oxidase subunit IV
MANDHDEVTGSLDVPAHAGPTFNTYLGIFGALAFFTLLSFLIRELLGQGNFAGAGLIMVVAVCKAVLVAMFFMHLKFDWPKLYFVVIPVLILTVMMLVVLLPDIVIDWHTEAQ